MQLIKHRARRDVKRETPTTKKRRQLVVICRSCGYRWKPVPRYWKNHLTNQGFKMLKCQSCGGTNYLDPETLRSVYRYNSDL